MIYSNKIFFGMSNSISNSKEKETVSGGWGNDQSKVIKMKKFK
jgi:hypothetical protein